MFKIESYSNNPSSISFGRQVSVVIPRNGDLITSKYLNFSPAGIRPKPIKTRMKVFQFQNSFVLEEIIKVFTNPNQIYLRDD